MNLPTLAEPTLIRAFLALELTAEIRDNLKRTVHRLRFTAMRIAWVPPENWHVTLLFLGDAAPDRLTELMTRLRQATPPLRACAGTVAELGFFGPPAAPRIIWAGVADATGRLAELIRTVQAVAEPLGWPPEKRDSRPHITLGRVKPGPRDPAWPRRLERARDSIWGELPVASLALMQSHLRPEGARYVKLDEVRLAP